MTTPATPDGVKDLPELPPIGPHDHPEPWAFKWTETEIRAIQSYARAALEQREAELRAANERARMLFDAKNHFADRATAAESRLGKATELIESLSNDLHLIDGQAETPDGDGVTVNVQLWAERWINRITDFFKGVEGG